MLANVDVDGVVSTQFVDVIPEFAEAVGWDTSHPIDSWAFYEKWTDPDGAPGEFPRFYNEVWKPAVYEADVYYQGKPIPGAMAGVRALEAAGYEVRFVTSLTFHDDPGVTGIARSHRSMWLADWFGSQDVVFTHGGKQGYPADLVIDDKPDLSWVQEGATENFLYRQPWNEGILTEGHRVDWPEIIEWCTKENA